MKKEETKIFGPVEIDPEKNGGYVQQHSDFFRELDKTREVLILTHWTMVNHYCLLKAGDKIIPVENFLEAIGQEDFDDGSYPDYEDQLVEILTAHEINFKWEVRAAMGDEGTWSNAEEFFRRCTDPEGFGKWARNGRGIMSRYCLQGCDHAYKYVGNLLADDKDFFREVISQPENSWQLFGWGILKFAGDNIKDDEEVVLMAIARDNPCLFPEKSSFHFASERLRGDEKFCRRVIEVDDRAEVFWAMEETIRRKLVDEKYNSPARKSWAKEEK